MTLLRENDGHNPLYLHIWLIILFQTTFSAFKVHGLCVLGIKTHDDATVVPCSDTGTVLTPSVENH